MSCSDARRLANRHNARKSTGPNTEIGKLAARLDSLSRGLRDEANFVPFPIWPTPSPGTPPRCTPPTGPKGAIKPGCSLRPPTPPLGSTTAKF